MEVIEKVVCYHCGNSCTDTGISVDEKTFCCEGCRLVFELIDDNGLCAYYQLESHPGTKASAVFSDFEHFDSPQVRSSVLTFESPQFARARFNVPSIHCSSCIWLLENLNRLEGGVSRSEVNFNRKEVDIDFDPRSTTLSRIAGRMASIGYPPQVELRNQPAKTDRSLVVKLGVAGFVFGNVMLFSFPEYLGMDSTDSQLGRLFSWLNLLLSTPVLLYSASDYFTSAARTFRQRQINIDVPIALGLFALFFRSAYDIASATGPGYLDSFTGLVFFLLIGRWFQSRTFEALSFDRDFNSYFPLAVQRLAGKEWKSSLVSSLLPGDQIRIRNLEVVPADSVLLSSEDTFIDYSFVTGEARPVKVSSGETVFAGGRLLGKPVTLQVLKEASNSHLTSLWNNEAFRKRSESRYKKIIDRAARKFTWIVLAIAVAAAVYWYSYRPAEMWLVITSVLMVACPCALALAAPFTYGTMLAALGRTKLYLKNADIVERMATIDTVVFDKTGTITHGEKPGVEFYGVLSQPDRAAVRLLASGSTHPLSIRITESIEDTTTGPLQSFREFPSKGLEGTVGGRFIRLGSSSFVGVEQPAEDGLTRVFVSIDGELKGHFAIQTSLRRNIGGMLKRLGRICRALLSGDNENDRTRMTNIFPSHVELLFNQTPIDKMNFISQLQASGKKVLMVGDGLNDAGALKHADVGIAVTDDAGMFTPGCDAILQGSRLPDLDKYLMLARRSTRILKTAFVLSFAYNAVALSFAVTGHLSPLVAAILMPLSSVSVVSFSSAAVTLAVRKTFPPSFESQTAGL